MKGKKNVHKRIKHEKVNETRGKQQNEIYIDYSFTQIKFVSGKKKQTN